MPAALALAGCGQGEAQKSAPPQGRKVMRTIYRDDKAMLLVVMPDGPGAPPSADCTQPLLIDPASGAVRAISAQEAAERQRRMELVGASEGNCLPR
ncbi:hypothetical protein [Novosphingobium cyanobacteriorum]|uniref:Lipoprotein n=1 Tax=Novosphingobium cyanobacteriorum TaxID=3024215 RepID=A0ABT6CFI5_9SPHN|nr:hypothetical protein [Novosphingobium cyanobacteriorum]MDF8332684.1 hypothetical protein [Novosphingobium cyanobacteriorum]